MRDDLLHAEASVDWAISNLPIFQQKVIPWMKENLEIVLEDPDPASSHHILVVIEKTHPPLSFNVEVGCMINAIRSGLDILATSLAYRYGAPRPDKSYFPVARSREHFDRGDYKGAELVKILPAREREIIESLEPYGGGNNLLVMLHDFDVQRKHRSLITFRPITSKFGVTGPNVSRTFVARTPSFPRVNNKTELGILAKGAAKPGIELHAFVAFDEALAPKGTGVIATLKDFAGMAKSIIRLFDTP